MNFETKLIQRNKKSVKHFFIFILFWQAVKYNSPKKGFQHLL